VKTSGRDEPIWVVIHICVEIAQGISLYSYPYLKPVKPYVSLYVFSSTKSEKKRAEQVLPGGWGMGDCVQIMYTHVSKCKNDTC
jgi:hypothetical protein